MKARFFVVMFLCLVISYVVDGQSKLVTYPAPDGAELVSDFTVQVRQPGGEWKNLPTYAQKVDEVRESRHRVETASLAYFDFSGNIQVSITVNRGSIATTRVRPASCGISPKVAGKTLLFELDRPRNLSVEVNGDIFHNLHLFANPVETNVPKRDDKNVVYFGPGIHKLPNQTLLVKSNQTVYIAGGAIVEGRIRIENAQNVKVVGRGRIVHVPGGGIHTANSRNVLIEGVITTQCATGGSDTVTIRNVKSISYFQWGDGMNVFASKNVLFDGVFCRNSDDCTTVYGTRNGYTGSSSNITMQNSTLWADVGHPIFIGIHGDAKNPDLLENLNYLNIDILNQKEKQIDYQGCLAINVGDNNLVRNVRFENIRIEEIRQGQLINLRVAFNKNQSKAPGRGIENVVFKNISYTGKKPETSIISGYDEARKIKNIRFENLVINGELISDIMPTKPKWYKTGDISGFFIGEHVENVEFVTVK